MRAHTSGQAAVETVGILVAIVLAVAATTTWLVANARPPGRPPEVVAHVARPLGFPDSVRYWALPAVPYGQEGAGEPIGDLLRGLRGPEGSWWRAYLRSRWEWDKALARRLAHLALEVVSDPGAAASRPSVLERAPGLPAYIRHLRSLPRDRMWAELHRDTADLSGDLVFEGLRLLLRRKAATVIRRPPTAPPRDASRP